MDLSLLLLPQLLPLHQVPGDHILNKSTALEASLPDLLLVLYSRSLSTSIIYLGYSGKCPPFSTHGHRHPGEVTHPQSIGRKPLSLPPPPLWHHGTEQRPSSWAIPISRVTWVRALISFLFLFF